MAAAIVPLVAGLAPLIPQVIDLITGLVHKAAPAAEAAGGPKTGPVKFANVYESVWDDLVAAHTAGAIAEMPDPVLVKAILQAVVTSMQLSNTLSPVAKLGAPAKPSAPPDGLMLTPGQTIIITCAAA